MELSFESLVNAGAFTGRPVKKTITWENNDGEKLTAETYVRPVGYQTVVSDITAGDKDIIAARIAAHICKANGEPAFTYEQVIGTADKKHGALNGSLTVALLAVINEVITAGKSKP